MNTIIIPSELVARLGELRQTTELRDQDGKILGLFQPHAERVGVYSVWSEAEADEAEKILARDRDLGRSLEDIWRDLKGQGARE